MRFVWLFFKVLLGVGMVVAVGGVVAAGFVVISQVSSLRGDLAEAYRLSRKPRTSDVTTCRGSQEPSGKQPIPAYQLRFTDDTHYLIEAVCADDLLTESVLVAEGELSWGVGKQAGYSGMRFLVPRKRENGEEERVPQVGQVALTWRDLVQARIGFNEGSFTTEYGFTRVERNEVLEARGNVAAVAACAGWGFSCCDAVTEVGEGRAETVGVSDCPGSCHEVCLARPIVLFFNTDPGLTPDSRQLELSGGEALVLFSYATQDYDGQVKQVTVDFGDGEEFTSTNAKDTLSHTYRCSSLFCRFAVSLSAVDDDGLRGVESRAGQITLIQYGR